MKKIFYKRVVIPGLFFILPFCGNCFGVLTHEAIIDALWDNSIVPLLKAKYPSATADQLKEAHAYAYGGAVVPDMGYYPFSSVMFTNLVHYVRSGDMVSAMLRDASDLNEYAFAIGFLTHYNADNYGHPLATNRSVPIVYPKLERKFGSVVTYADDPISHMRMEFGFDVLQTAKGNYASQAYHDFIGFKVDTAVLSRAFLETYGLNINDVFNHRLSLAVETFRFIIANVFPVIVRSAWAAKSSDIIKKDSTATSRKFRYKMRLREFNKEYGKGYRHPGTFPAILSFVIHILPKVGPLRPLHFKTPTAQSEKYFDQSFDSIMFHNTANLKQLNPDISLKDKDFDTGKPTEPCEYSLADDTYDKWVVKLKNDEFKYLTDPIKQNILTYYRGLNTTTPGRYSKTCNAVYGAVNDIKNTQPVQTRN